MRVFRVSEAADEGRRVNTGATVVIWPHCCSAFVSPGERGNWAHLHTHEKNQLTARSHAVQGIGLHIYIHCMFACRSVTVPPTWWLLLRNRVLHMADFDTLVNVKQLVWPNGSYSVSGSILAALHINLLWVQWCITMSGTVFLSSCRTAALRPLSYVHVWIWKTDQRPSSTSTSSCNPLHSDCGDF